MKEYSEEYVKEILKKVKQDPIHLDTDEEMWEKVMERISASESEKKPSYIWYASAATVLICLIAGLGVYWMNSNAQDQNVLSKTTVKTESYSDKKVEEEIQKGDNSSASDQYTKNKGNDNTSQSSSIAAKEKPGNITSGNEVLTHQLSDGSVVSLNKNSQIGFPKISKNEITLSLSGEAYFEVVPDKKRSFNVYLGDSYLKVVGTKFNVRNMEDEPHQEISVSEGIVRVYRKGDTKGIEVKRGELLQISREGEFQLTQVDPLLFISWKTGVLIFKATKLEEVTAMLSRIYKTEIALNSSIKNCTFTGNLSQMSFEEALRIIEATTSFTIKRDKNNVSISGSTCY